MLLPVLWIWHYILEVVKRFVLLVFVFLSRSAKEAEDNIRKALAKGQVLPKEERFDSNCITPGMDMYMYIIVSLYLACVCICLTGELLFSHNIFWQYMANRRLTL